MRRVSKIVLSAFSGTSSTFVYLALGHFLDMLMNPKYSNLMALLVGAAVNFVLQNYTFIGSVSFSKTFMIKYIISEIIIIAAVQFGVTYFLDNKQIDKYKLPTWLQKYYNTVIRIITSTLVFLFISFPLRSYFVFK